MVTCEACPLCEVFMWKIISSLSAFGFILNCHVVILSGRIWFVLTH